MGTSAKKIKPEEFILSVFSPEERLDAAFKVASQAFKKSALTMSDIEQAVSRIRENAHEASNKNSN